MADPEQVKILKQGSKAWNHWLEQQPHNVRIYLNGADLRHIDLRHANLRHAALRSAKLNAAKLYAANLHGSDLYGVNLSGAILSNADLSEANLSDVNLSGAILSDANLRGADLRGANLSSARLRGANLSSAMMVGTVFANVDLSESKGLSEIEHMGPSCVELHNVLLPQDDSALHFLRNCGVPDEWINFYRATMMHPFQYHSCFISYSNKDEVLAKRLHADLQAQGVRCWFAPEDMKIGDKLRARIDEAIHLQDKLLLLLSEYSLASNWVEVEVEAALDKEQYQGREVLFPVRIDESVMQTSQTWAKQLRRSRHIGDFTNWTDPQTYNKAFKRLLRDLKAQN